MLVFLFSAGRVLCAETAGKILFQDSFEKTIVLGDVNYTNPEVFVSDKVPGGRITGPFELVEGKKGKALRLKGLTNVRYLPMEGNIDLTGGELSFWIKLNFDPQEDTPRRKNELSNQLFIAIWGSARVMVYNAGGNTYALGVQDAARGWSFGNNFRQDWEKDEWHFIQLKWGKDMELWCDGEKQISGEWTGLFGTLPVNLKETDIVIGSHIGYTSVESEFTIDELVIRGPK